MRHQTKQVLEAWEHVASVLQEVFRRKWLLLLVVFWRFSHLSSWNWTGVACFVVLWVQFSSIVKLILLIAQGAEVVLVGEAGLIASLNSLFWLVPEAVRASAGDKMGSALLAALALATCGVSTAPWFFPAEAFEGWTPLLLCSISQACYYWKMLRSYTSTEQN